AAAAGADREPAGEVRVAAGRKGRDLLMADVEPLDAAVAAQGIGEAIEAVADDAIDALHAGGGESLDHLVRTGRCNFAPPPVSGRVARPGDRPGLVPDPNPCTTRLETPPRRAELRSRACRYDPSLGSGVAMPKRCCRDCRKRSGVCGVTKNVTTSG